MRKITDQPLYPHSQSPSPASLQIIWPLPRSILPLNPSYPTCWSSWSPRSTNRTSRSYPGSFGASVAHLSMLTWTWKLLYQMSVLHTSVPALPTIPHAKIYDSRCSKHLTPYCDALKNFVEISPKSFSAVCYEFHRFSGPFFSFHASYSLFSLFHIYWFTFTDAAPRRLHLSTYSMISIKHTQLVGNTTTSS